MVTPKILNCLWFDHGQARKTADFYTSIFPDSHVRDANIAPADFPGGRAGDEITIAFTVLGIPFLGVNGGPDFRPNEAVSFQNDVETLFGALQPNLNGLECTHSVLPVRC